MSVERFSLLQAALWLLRGKLPVSEQDFASAKMYLTPDEATINGPLGLMVQLLHAGALSATAGLGGRNSTGTFKQLKHYPDNVPAPPSAWRFKDVYWNDSAMPFDWRKDTPTPFAGAITSNVRRSETPVLFWYPITVARDDIIAAFPELLPKPTVDNTTMAKHPGGAPEKYDWTALFGAASHWIHENGFPEKQASLTEYLKEWSLENWKKEPSETQLKAKIREFLAAFRKESGN